MRSGPTIPCALVYLQWEVVADRWPCYQACCESCGFRWSSESTIGRGTAPRTDSEATGESVYRMPTTCSMSSVGLMGCSSDRLQTSDPD